MDDRIATPLPVWIVTGSGDYVNLAQVERLYLKAEDAAEAESPCCVMAFLVTGRVVLAECSDYATAQAALDKLTRLLPMALVDMDLDIIAPLERDRAEQAESEAA